ncbi:MAG: hypothetical protein ACM3JK_06660 [Betaproteobacteria bacterium]
MSEHNSLVASFANHHLAKTTAEKLHQAGFDMQKLSIIGKNRHEIQEEGEWGGAAVIDGLSVLDAAQYSCIPRESILDYEAELAVDRLLLVTHGTPDEISRAKTVIDTAHPDGWDGNVGCTVYYGCTD